MKLPKSLNALMQINRHFQMNYGTAFTKADDGVFSFHRCCLKPTGIGLSRTPHGMSALGHLRLVLKAATRTHPLLL